MSFCYDNKWYGKLIKLAPEQDYEYFVGSDLWRQRQKKDFMADKIRNPQLDYPLINLEKIKNKRRKLEELADLMADKEKKTVVREAYREKIQEKIVSLDMIGATKELADNRDKRRIGSALAKFSRGTEKLYGQPTPGVFNFALDQFRTKIIRNMPNKNNVISGASGELLSALPMPEEKWLKKYVFWQNKRNLSRVKKYLWEELNVLDETHEPDNLYQPEEIRDYFSLKIKQLNIPDWEVMIDPNYQTVSVDQNRRTVFIPKSRQIDGRSIQKLVRHEIGVHVLRRVNGENSKLKLLGLGLANYEVGEEGLASLVEGLFDSQIGFGFFHLLSYISIGLVYGLDGTKRDFRDIYEILVRLYLYIGLISWPEKEIEEIRLKSFNNAFNRCVRIFRGTNCQFSGVCFTRDLIYLKGKIFLWDVINHNPEELKRVYCGKYNPANEKHIKLLDELDIR